MLAIFKQKRRDFSRFFFSFFFFDLPAAFCEFLGGMVATYSLRRLSRGVVTGELVTVWVRAFVAM
jgi:hypothetical protein